METDVKNMFVDTEGKVRVGQTEKVALTYI